MTLQLKRVTAQEKPVYLASKFLHIQLLIDQDEMKSCLEAMKRPKLFLTSGVHKTGESELTIENFLAKWNEYIEEIRNGHIVDDTKYRPFFSLSITDDTHALYAIDVAGDREIITPVLPHIQVHLHRFDFSPVDHNFRPNVFGKGTISWGLELSYPQIFQDSVTRTVHNALDQTQFRGAGLFRDLQQWVRSSTKPTPFLVDGKKVHVPIRIGFSCLTWINNHAELATRDLIVDEH